MTSNSDQEWQLFRLRMESLVESVSEQIQNYPPPIPACDAQFNHLLELRQTLPQELSRLEVAAAEKSMSVEDFVQSSPCKGVLSGLVRDSH